MNDAARHIHLDQQQLHSGSVSLIRGSISSVMIVYRNAAGAALQVTVSQF